MPEVLDYKARVSQKAHELFMQFGIRSVSMDEIAESVGSSKKTLYQYFKDKDTLVHQVMANVISSNIHKTRWALEKSENAIHECFLSLTNATRMYENINVSVLNDLKKYHPKVFRFFLKFKQETMFKAIEANIIRGIEEELYRGDIIVKLVSWYRVESIFLYFNPDLQHIVNLTLIDYEKQIFTMFLHGLVTPKGLKIFNKYKQQLDKKTPNAKA